MGDVYRAKDTRLDRTVALKILPASLAEDEEMHRRFEREARTISALSHPNICTLFDLGTDGGRDYLVMEYLEGETLEQRITRGPLDIPEALRIGCEIADALEKAHRQGIVHRDLKPGNIVLTRGMAKLLDFGLAKWMPRQDSVLGRAEDATARLTEQGTILGTVPYMAPEQLEGKEADARTDIFALGAILYEMVSGVRAFKAASNASLIVLIMREDPPPIAQIRRVLPAGLDRIMRTCLAKNPDDRFQSAHDVRIALEMFGASTGEPVATVEKKRRAWLVPAMVSLLALAAIGAAATAYWMRPGENRPAYRFNVYPPPGSTFPSLGEGGGIALSPDGRQLVFEATTPEGKGTLWLRPLDSEVPKMLSGTEGGECPFWSPDGRAIAFFADGKLKRLNLPEGPVQTICDAPSGRGGAWNGKDVILFAPASHGVLYRVSASGGQPQPLTSLTPDSDSHRWPVFIDDDRFLFVVQSDRPAAEGVFVGSLGSQETRKLLPTSLSVAFVPPDRLYHVREDILVRQRLDPRKLELSGEPTTLANQMVYYTDRAYVPVTAAGETVVFRRNGSSSMRLTWIDRAGVSHGTIGEAGEYEGVSISPDGERVAFGYFDPKESFNHIAMAMTAVGAPRRFTFSKGNQYSPVWSAEGQRLAFSDDQAGIDTLASRPLAGTSTEKPLIPTPKSSTYAQSWSPDGEQLLFRAQDVENGDDIHVLSLKSGKVSEYVGGAADQSQAQFSPDGAWVAYTSTESGRLEVYIQSFPATGAKWQVSTAGGEQPRWRRDGKELFYLAPDRHLMAVTIKTPGAFDGEEPRMLFATPNSPVGDINVSQSYDVMPGGAMFLVAAADAGSPQSPLTVVTK
jgi:Tol biopolymer transport system component